MPTPTASDALRPVPAADMNALRRELRARRRALGKPRQIAAARRLCRRVVASAEFRKARRIALYIAADGEIDPAPLCRAAWRKGKRTYLPVLHPSELNQLDFAAYSRSDRLLPNRFGIPEPIRRRGRIRPWQLDLVLSPLVGFDDAGNRLGMGGGFYDRTFARTRMAHWPRRPVLCGLAHRCQRVAGGLPARGWDVPLKRVFTD